MKVIKNPLEFQMLFHEVQKCIKPNVSFPKNVFTDDYKSFYLFDGEGIGVASVFNDLKTCASAVGDTKFWLIALNPHPIDYYKYHFDFFGAFEFSVEDGVSSYFEAINNYPPDSKADALTSRGDTLVFLSTTGKWCVYTERDTISVYAFREFWVKDAFEKILPHILKNATDAAELAYAYHFDEAKKKEKITQFSENHACEC